MSGERVRATVLGFALAALVCGVYAPVLDHEFLAYDDVLYVTESSRVQGGLTAETVGWALTATEAGNWHPLVWISHAADVEFFGLDAGAHHRTSVVVHALATALLFAVLFSLTGSLAASLLAAALFGLHPLRVESVAWIAERKDVLCGAFSIAALGAELRYARSPGASRLLLVAMCVVGALMSKAMAVTLPVALLLFDIWPLGRLRNGPPGIAGPVPQTSAVRLALEKLPLLALSLAASAVAVRAQSAGGAIAAVESWPLTARLANAATSYWVYLRKTVWPNDLAVFYPYPVAGIPEAQTAAAAASLVAVSAGAVYLVRSRPGTSVSLPGASFAWFWFLGTLVPVIGLVTVGEQALADRYSYIPHIGFAVALGAAFASLDRRGGLPRAVALAVGTLAVLASVATTRALLPHWRNDETLFARALAVTADSRVAHLNYGNAIEGIAPAEEQIRHFERAVELGPSDANAHYHLGRALALNGDTRRGVEHYRMSLSLDDRQPKAWNNLGNELKRLGDRQGATAAYRRALAIDELHPSANFNLALSLLDEGETEEARRLAQRYASAEWLPPSHEANLDALARAFAAAGDLAGASELLAAAQHASPALRSLLGGLEWERGNERSAIRALREAFALDPGNPAIANDFAWMLATARDAALREPARAIEIAERAMAASANDSVGQRDPEVLDTLAAAHAAAGDFETAKRLASEAIELAEPANGGGVGDALLAQLRAHASAYRMNRALHELSPGGAGEPAGPTDGEPRDLSRGSSGGDSGG